MSGARAGSENPRAQRAPYRISMLSTQLFTIGLSISALLVAILAVYVAFRAQNYCYRNSAAKLSSKALTDLQVAVTENADSLTALHESLRKLRAKITMRQHRVNGKTPAGDIPDSRVDPDGYKRAMRLKLRQSGVVK